MKQSRVGDHAQDVDAVCRLFVFHVVGGVKQERAIRIGHSTDHYRLSTFETVDSKKKFLPLLVNLQ
jgi:hypothetical protein